MRPREGNSGGNFLSPQILRGFCKEEMEVSFSVISKDILQTHGWKLHGDRS